MKITFNYTYSFGGWTLGFSKEIELPCVPFFGLMIIESDKDGNELSFTISHDRDIISYCPYDKSFHVDIRKYWKPGTDADNVDSVLENHKIFKWKREDTTNIKEMKDLMIRNYPNRN